MARYMRIIGGDGYLWPWTEILAKRKDMEEVEAPSPFDGKPVVGKADASHKPADAATAVDPVASPEFDAYAITDKAELRKLLKEKGIKVANNASLKKLQDALVGAG